MNHPEPNHPSHEDALPEEQSARQFGEIALAKGYLTAEQLEEALREQERSPFPSLIGQVLLDRRLLSTDQFLEILNEQNLSIWHCDRCHRRLTIRHHTGQEPPKCLRCETELRQDEVLPEDRRLYTPYMAATIPGLKPGVQLARYFLVREVARGALGVVFEAEDPVKGKKVALKVLTSELSSRQEIRRLHREANHAARLQHPNIAAVREVGLERGVHFVAVDYIAGGSLAHQLYERHARRGARAEKKPPPIRADVQMLETVARALHYAHRKGVIHRDLKPGNILLKRDGTPVVTDFGLCRTNRDATDVSQSGMTMGTPAYMAPEQVQGKRSEIGVQSDLWALGATLYETLTGVRPFEGSTNAEAYQKILRDDPPPLSKAALPEGTAPTPSERAVDRDLETIVLKCLEKQKEHRYQTAEELAEDLRRYLHGAPIRARRPFFLRRLRRVVVKHKLASALAGLLLACLAGAGLWLWLAAQQLTSVEDSPLYREAHQLLTCALQDRRRCGRTEKLASAVREVRQLAQRALDRDPDDIGAHFVLGWACSLSEDCNSVIDECSQLLDRLPADRLPLYLRGHAWLNLYFREREQALRDWYRGESPAKGSPFHSALARPGEPTEEIKFLAPPPEARLIYLHPLISIYRDRACKDFETLKNSASGPAGLRECAVGLLALAQGEYDKARESLHRAATVAENKDEAWAILVQDNACVGMARAGYFSYEFLTRGETDHYSEQTTREWEEEVFPLIEEGLSRNRGLQELHLLRARLLSYRTERGGPYREEQLRKAETSVSAAISLWPDASAEHLLRATLRFNRAVSLESTAPPEAERLLKAALDEAEAARSDERLAEEARRIIKAIRTRLPQ